jgi:hypothetical protein
MREHPAEARVLMKSGTTSAPLHHVLRGTSKVPLAPLAPLQNFLREKSEDTNYTNQHEFLCGFGKDIVPGPRVTTTGDSQGTGNRVS